jgi:acetyl/propionyl-CoA carboxylase alpha subunit
MVPEYYDPMIAKIIASGPTRDAARTALIEALRDLVVLGVATNREKLIQILESEPFRSGRIHTGVLEEIGPLPAEAPPSVEDLARIVEALEAASPANGGATAAAEKAPDPWAAASSWRLA